MKKIPVICVVLSATLIFGCGGSNVEGNFRNVDNDQEFIELKDGNFYLKAGSRDFSGKYTVAGKSITLNPGSKMAAKGRIENGMIIDSDGTKWKKK